MKKNSVVTTSKIIFGAGATFAVMSAAGCGATDSSCEELQRTCGCDDRKPCPDDGAAGKAGADVDGAGDTAGGDAADEKVTDAKGADAEVGFGGKGGAAGSGGAGASGASGKGGTGGTRDDAAAETSVADAEFDSDPKSDVAVDAVADGGGELDAADESDAMEAGLDATTMDMGPTCDVTKSPSVESCLIDEQYGVFVSTLGNDLTGSGTRAAPYATIGKGLDAASAQNVRVYACDEGTGYDEQLVLADGAKLYGGFDCSNWTYATTRRSIVRASAGPALAIHGVSAGVLVEDVEVDAADAVALGTSSIGALIEDASNVVLRRMKIVAGEGGEGLGGAIGAKGLDAPDVTSDLAGSAAMCPVTITGQLGGAWSQASTCGSRGGGGGSATLGSDGSNGVAGNPRANVAPPDIDNGGSKGPTGGDGGIGSPGKGGTPGVAATTSGMFTSAGYTPASAALASTGVDGNVGQGGGGGGASNATDSCIGASGGAGGMGGCGGKGGVGGAGGGASIALVNWNSALTLDACELVAHGGGLGGKGGSGGAGGLGKVGAAGGAGLVADGGVVVGKGGKGGNGGNGGMGGPGAGGTGGPSYALVYQGPAPIRTACTLTQGAAGLGGLGGTSGAITAAAGSVGQAAAEYVVP